MIMNKLGLLSTNHLLAGQWHYSLNNNLTPDDVTLGSNQKVWWQCPVAKDHIWHCPVKTRHRNGSGCGCCAGLVVCKSNCLATIRQDIAAEWHPTKNQLKPTDVTVGSNKKAWWVCSPGHGLYGLIVWKASKRGHGCPKCLCKAQTRLYELIVRFYPTRQVLYNFKHDKLRFKRSKCRMEFDI